jgi:hypothetical protein
MHSHIRWDFIILAVFKLLKMFGIFGSAVVVFWIRKMVQKRVQKRAMEGWPATDATIQWGKIHREGGRYWAEVTYSYFVGEYRSGKYVRGFRREEQAEEFIRQLKDKRTRVHYKEAAPDKSVILDRDLELIVLLEPQLR